MPASSGRFYIGHFLSSTPATPLFLGEPRAGYCRGLGEKALPACCDPAFDRLFHTTDRVAPRYDVERCSTSIRVIARSPAF